MTGAEVDDSEALRAALAEALPLWWKAEPPYTATIERLLPLVLAYGHEQATRAAEQAEKKLLVSLLRFVPRIEDDTAADALTAWINERNPCSRHRRADDLGRRTP